MSLGRHIGAVIALGVLGGCALVAPVPDAGLPVEELDPRPQPAPMELAVPDGQAGDGVEVARGIAGGDRFTLTVQRDGRGGVCFELFWGDDRSGGCGALPGGGVGHGSFGMIGSGMPGDAPTHVDGLVARDVSTVWVETAAGERASAIVAPLAPADVDANAFVVFLRAGVTPTVLVAAGSDGEVVDRFELGGFAPPSEEAGAHPTVGSAVKGASLTAALPGLAMAAT